MVAETWEDQRASAHPQMRAPSLADRVRMLSRDVVEVAADHLELGILELQRAANSLVKVLCAAVVVAILLVTAWLTLLASGIVWATTAGVSWVGALAIAAVINLVAGGVLFAWIRTQHSELLFAATLRQLRRRDEPEEKVS